MTLSIESANGNDEVKPDNFETSHEEAPQNNDPTTGTPATSETNGDNIEHNHQQSHQDNQIEHEQELPTDTASSVRQRHNGKKQ